MIVLNEEKFARDVISGARQDVKSLKKKVELLTRYHYHVLHKDDDTNYRATVSWMELHHDIFCENSYSNLISGYIKKAPKRPFYNIESVKFTSHEMQVIKECNDIRQEKVLFVLLCMAKVQRDANGFDNGFVSYNITDLFKMARVNVPTKERTGILNKLYRAGLIDVANKVDAKGLFVRIMGNAEDDIALELNEQDCNELAYAYLKYIGDKKISRCSKCGKLIKPSKKFGNVCKGCQENDTESRTNWCIDCGKEFEVSVFNTKTCRCEDCQNRYRKNYMRDLMKEKRVSTAPENSTTQN